MSDDTKMTHAGYDRPEIEILSNVFIVQDCPVHPVSFRLL